MAVDFAYVVLGEIEASTRLTDFRAEMRFEDQAVDGSPECGECLHAQSFALGEQEVYVGTEDRDMLSRRYSWIKFDGFWPDSFAKNGLDIVLDSIPGRTPFSFHFVLAAQPLGRVMSDGEADVSAWFAVDAQHQILRQLALEDLPLVKLTV